MALPEVIIIPLADAERLVRAFDSYDDLAGHASKWGYTSGIPSTGFAAIRRLREAVDPPPTSDSSNSQVAPSSSNTGSSPVHASRLDRSPDG